MIGNPGPFERGCGGRPVLGVDVGGSKRLAVGIDAQGRRFFEHRQRTGRETSPDDLIGDIAGLAATLRRNGHELGAIGVGFPGLVDARRGLVRSSVMLDGWHAVPLAARLTAATGLPCLVDNDANAAAWAELQHRPELAAGDDPWLFVTVGTGIGGAIGVGGQLLRGATGVAGEIGNTTIDRQGTRCWCGRRGCLNVVASGSAIERLADLAPGSLAARWRAGDPETRRIALEAAQALGHGLANAVQLLNPSYIVLGGGVAELGEDWLAAVRRTIAAEAFAEAAQVCRLERAVAGYEAGALGAALLARQHVARTGQLAA